MKKITRKDFLLLSAAVGLSSLPISNTWGGSIDFINRGLGDYSGPLKEELASMLEKCSRGEMSSEEFINILGDKLSSYDLEAEFKKWIDQGSDNNNERKILSSFSLRRIYQVQLFFVPPFTSHPPHAHHDVMSTQVLLKGNLHIRQYERIAKKRGELLIKKTADKTLFPGDQILMDEWNDNVHWFGSESEGALILNVSSTGVPGKTFNARGTRLSMRYHIDPTLGKNVTDNMAWVPEVSKREGEAKFSKAPLSSFDDGLNVP